MDATVHKPPTILPEAVAATFLIGVLLFVSTVTGQTQPTPTPEIVGEPFVFPVPEGLSTPARWRLDRAFQSGKSCGRNSLCLLLNLYGIETDYEQVENALLTNELGSNLSSIQDASAKLGLPLVIRRDVSATALHPRFLPAIVHLRSISDGGTGTPSDHFTVVVSKVGDLFKGYDTTNMIAQSYTIEYLARNMSGVVAFPTWQYRSASWNRRAFLGIASLTGIMAICQFVRLLRITR